MKLSVIIPTYNRKEILKDTLNAISSQVTLDKNNIEFIVVNDGEDVLDELAEEYKKISLRIIKNMKKGAASARNTGVNYSKGEILLFHDDDILPCSDYFKRHIEMHQQFESAIVMAHRLYPKHLEEHAIQYPFGRYKLQYEYDVINGIEKIKEIRENLFQVNNIATFSCSMPKTIYEKVGSFNERFEYAGCEDAEFSYRAMQKGYRCVYDEKNICYHNELDNFELHKWLQRQSTGIKGAVVFCQLHPEGKSSPHWYTNTPLQWKDSFNVKMLKIKKWFLSRKPVEQFLFWMVWFLEKIKAPDKFLFRFYNALWLGNSYRSFSEEYKKHFQE